MTTRVSVCMATYNGIKFLKEQLDSILPQLGPTDELIVVDDCSTDNTMELLQQVCDSRLSVVRNPSNQGVNRTFEHAIRLAKGEVIVMTDQDDVWIPGRLDLMLNGLHEERALLVSTNFDLIGKDGRPLDNPDYVRLESTDSARHVANIVGIFVGRRNYYGCAMAFHRKLLDLVLPIPAYVESHDLWIALAANLIGSNVHFKESTLMRRIHGNNVSVVQRSLAAKFKSRLVFLQSLATLTYRIITNRNYAK